MRFIPIREAPRLQGGELHIKGKRMMHPRIVITHPVDREIVELLSHSFEIVPNMTGETLPRHEVLRRAKDAQAVMISPSDVIDEDFLDRCPHLRIVAGTFEGIGQVDIQACTDRGVWVTNVSCVIAASAAVNVVSARDFAFAPENVGRAAALEAAANICEASIGERPKGAVNSLVLPRTAKRIKPGNATSFS